MLARSLEEGSELLVELGPPLLGDALVRSLPDEAMLEAHGLVSGHFASLGSHQLLSRQGQQVAPQRSALDSLAELAERPDMEDEALDGSTLDDMALLGGQP